MDDRVDVRSMEADVKQYLNTQRYTGFDWEGPKVPVDVTIYLTGRSQNRYNGRLAIVSRRLANNEPNTGAPLLRMFDQSWTFEWSFSPNLSFQTMRYDAFTSLIDFYVLMAIGLDMDTYDDLGGSSAFESAKQIAGLGNAIGIKSYSTNFQPGEITRMSVITEILDPRFVGLRRYLYDYHYATDDYALDSEKGQAAMELVLSDLDGYKRNTISNKSAFLQIFFDAKAGELADIFRGKKQTPAWDYLRFLDPGNTQMYEAARDGK